MNGAEATVSLSFFNNRISCVSFVACLIFFRLHLEVKLKKREKKKKEKAFRYGPIPLYACVYVMRVSHI